MDVIWEQLGSYIKRLLCACLLYHKNMMVDMVESLTLLLAITFLTIQGVMILPLCGQNIDWLLFKNNEASWKQQTNLQTFWLMNKY